MANSISSSSFKRSEDVAITGEEHRIYERGKFEFKPNGHLTTKLISALTNDEDDADSEESQTELDSHANMVVAGKHAAVLADTGSLVDINPFTPDCNLLKQVKIVDAAV